MRTDSKGDKLGFWEVETGQPVRALPYVGYWLGLSPDGKVLAFGGKDGELQLLDASTGTLMRTFPRTATCQFYGDWRILRQSAPIPSATPPGGVPFKLAGDFRDWFFFSVEVELENHSDAAAYFTAPDAGVELRPEGRQESYPLLFVWPASGSGTTEWSLSTKKNLLKPRVT